MKTKASKAKHLKLFQEDDTMLRGPLRSLMTEAADTIQDTTANMGQIRAGRMGAHPRGSISAKSQHPAYKKLKWRSAEAGKL